MKTIKNLLYVLVAFAALAFVGCVKDDTYTEGGDISGDKVYISNAKSTFYVQSKEDKEKAEEELEKLNKNSTRADIKPELEDDKQIELEIGRNAAKLDVLDVTVELTMLTEEASLFTLPQGSTKLSSTSKTTTYSVPVSFAEGADKAALAIGFDIHNLADNYDYMFNAALGEDVSGTQYGSSDFDFAINHMVPVELPFTDIGTVTLTQAGYDFPAYSNITIQIHNDDLKVIEDAKKAGTEPDLDYVRFFIPKFMYQIVSAAKDAGDSRVTDDYLDYFGEGDGLLLTMSPKYEPVYDYDHATQAHPIYPDLYKKVFPIFGIAGIDPSGNLNVRRFQSGLMISLINSPLLSNGSELHYTFAVGLFNGYNSSAVRVNNTYTYDMALMEVVGGNLTGSGYLNQIIEFTWDTNKLEEDWANYFKIDYNNDLMYTPVGEGTFKSEYKSNEASKSLYKGYESIAGNTVFYVADPYGTSTEENQLGLALLWNGTTATVAPEQPLGEQAFGKDLYISQSDDVKSAIEFAENGSIAKITFGVKIHFADGNKVGDYTETIEFAVSDASVAKFLGSFTQSAYEIYSPYYDGEGNPAQPKLSSYSSVVTIAQATDDAGKAIEGKVLISGIISEDYLAGEDGTLEGTFDATTNSIIIPAQFLKKPVWDLGVGYKLFPYFQPGETAVSAYNTQNGPMYFSIMGTPSNSIALYLKEDGSLYMGPSSTDGSGVATDGYAIVMYSYDADNNEFVEDSQVGELFSTFGVYGQAAPTFTPVAAEGASIAAKRVSVPKMISGGVDKAIKGTRNRIAVKNR